MDKEKKKYFLDVTESSIDENIVNNIESSKEDIFVEKESELNILDDLLNDIIVENESKLNILNDLLKKPSSKISIYVKKQD